MTSEHESHEMYVATDALMAAITGEEPPGEARADAASLDEHRKAEADVALLREQLGIIGDALAEEARPQWQAVPVRAPRNWRPVRRFAFAGIAVAAVAGVLSGMIWLLGQTGGVNSLSGGAKDESGATSADSAAGSPFSSPGYLACTRLVVEGDVTDVEQVAPDMGQERITLHVTRSYKPEKTKPEITFVIDEEAFVALRKGDHILVAVPHRSATPDYVLVGEKTVARERAGLTRALPASREAGCR
ncbi:hypothetical protein [Streptomyces acidicola]|uniref:hypothetical protein n=1 Tax=Streptomyces acidicola TaxID=2596892 RepID=UPI00341F075C